MSVETVQRSTPARTLPAAALSAAAAARSFYGAYGDPHAQASQQHTVPYVVGADVVIDALIFGLLLPWAARRPGRSAGWGLALGILALVTIPVTFWSGINVILAGAGMLLGIHAKPADEDVDIGSGLPAGPRLTRPSGFDRALVRSSRSARSIRGPFCRSSVASAFGCRSRCAGPAAVVMAAGPRVVVGASSWLP